MKMKDFARYLKYESFDKALHHIRQISSERTSYDEHYKSISDVLEDRTPEEIINEFNL